MESRRDDVSLSNPYFVSGRILSVGLISLVLFAGCNKQPAAPAAAPQSTTAQPAAPAPDSQQAQQAAPMNNEPAQAPQATAPEPPPPPPPQPVVYTIPSGTSVVIRTSGTLDAKKNSVGDSFSGSLVQSLKSQGVVLIKAGTPVSGTVVGAKGQGKIKGEGSLSIQLRAIGSNNVSSSIYEKAVSGKGSRSTKMIAGGTGGGALIGGIAGGGKGALIGGLVGGTAGTVGAATTGNKDVSIPAESTVTFTLTTPITVTVTPQVAPAAPVH